MTVDLSGRWPDILQSLGGLTPEQLQDRHQPCPACGGTDRYRWTRSDGPGGWFCNQCGGKDHRGGAGSGIDLLMRVRGWTSYLDAMRQVEQHLGITADRPEPPTKGAEFVWRYSSTFYVCRFPGKKIRPLSWDGEQWRWTAPPAPRPLYWARRLPDAPVLVAEGEKTADAAARLLPDHAVVTWSSGCKAIAKTDWSPLAGRRCVLWPDADDVGRAAMATLAPRLLHAGAAAVAIITPPADAPAGWDAADADAAAAAELLAGARPITAPEPPAPPAPPPAAPPPAAAPSPPAAAPFTCLGFDGDSYYYQPSSTGQVIRLTGPGHSSNNLCRIAELAYWETIYPSKSGVNWMSAVSSLFQQQARVGIFSPDRIRGRGTWSDDGRAILHLGDRLIVDGVPHSVMTPPPSRFHYQRLASIDLPENVKPLDDQRGYEILDIASRFHWEVPASGLLMAGWVALAPICGALSWRPHIWLTASAGSGKSAILDRFLGPLLESLAIWPEGNTTEAFIRQELRADALPVVFDEAESNEQTDRKRIQDILALARVASSSGRGVIGKGGADGAAQRFTIRSMFLMCSISTALKQGADRSRFAQLTLRNPNYLPKEKRIAHWSALDRDLSDIITANLGHQLLHRSVQSIDIIRGSVAAFRRAAADRFDSQREGDQYGTLLAGAWSLTNQCIASEADAYQLIDSNNWEPYREANELPDEQRCLQAILQHQLRVETDQLSVSGGHVTSKASTVTRTVWELIEAIQSPGATDAIPSSAAEAHLGRIGVAVRDDRLLISNTALGIQRILADTSWAHSWSTVLARLPDAARAGKIRFRGISAPTRAVSLPIAPA